MTNIKNMRKHRGNIQKYSGGGVRIFVAALLVLTLFWLLYSCAAIAPAAAQSPTVTPFPAAVATATAAANVQAQASAQRNQADALQRQADAARAQADASYSAAAQAASDARAALAAQQAGAAGEAIGRAEANISDGKAQLDRLGDVVNQLREITNLQAGQLISMTIALQQAQADKQTTLNAYNAAIETQETNDRNGTLLKIIGLFIMFLFLLVVLAFGANKLRLRSIRSDDGGATGGEIVDQE